MTPRTAGSSTASLAAHPGDGEVLAGGDNGTCVLDMRQHGDHV